MAINLEKLSFNKQKQLRFLNTVYRLAKARIYQNDIAEQLIIYGDKHDKILGQLALDSINEGQGFTIGIKGWIEDLAWQAMLAGENTGDWPKGIANATLNLKVNNASTGGLIKALFMPLVGLVAIILGAGAAGSKAFPALMEMTGKFHLTGIQGYAFSISTFFAAHGIPMILTTTISVVVIVFSLPYLTGKLRSKIDDYPIYRQYRLIQTAAILRSAGNLTIAGFGLAEIFEGLEKHSNKYMKSHIERILENIGLGYSNVGDILDTGLLNKSEQSSLKLLGAIGQVGESFLNSADIHGDQLTESINKISSLGSTFIKLFAAVTGGIIAGGLLSLAMGMASAV